MDNSSRRGGRPRGEVRLAIAIAARDLTVEQGGANYRELATRACVGFAVARDTAHNMARSGEMSVVRYRKIAGTSRTAAWYSLFEAQSHGGSGMHQRCTKSIGSDVESVLRSMSRTATEANDSIDGHPPLPSI